MRAGAKEDEIVNSDTAAVLVSRNESGSTLGLRGSFQLDAARQLHESALALAAAAQNVLVDCSQLAHLDGSAAQVLLALKEHLERSGASLRLTDVPQNVDKYLDWAGLKKHLGCGEEAGAPRKRKRTVRKRKP